MAYTKKQLFATLSARLINGVAKNYIDTTKGQNMTEKTTTENVRSMTEEELRDSVVPTFETIEGLLTYISKLTTREHDYGTAVYAMSMAAVAAFNHVASVEGVTGFQASCAKMDIIKRLGGHKDGFMLVDYSKLLYPQYEQGIPGFWEHIKRNKEQLKKRALELLEENDQAHPNVAAHWKKLSE